MSNDDHLHVVIAYGRVVRNLGRHPDASAFLYVGVTRQLVLDHDGGDAVASVTDVVLQPVDEVEVPFRVHRKYVAGMHPLRRPRWCFVGGRRVRIDVRRYNAVPVHAADDKLSRLPVRQGGAIGPDDATHDFGHWLTDGPGVRRSWVSEYDAGFGLSVDGADLHAETALKLTEVPDQRADRDLPEWIVDVVWLPRLPQEQRRDD